MGLRMAHVGLGGQGMEWLESAIPPNTAAGRLDLAAVVDTDPERLAAAQDAHDIPAERCFTDLETAIAATDADCCSVVTPPGSHAAVVDTAVAHGCHVISEKPIADTLAGSVRIAETVADAGLKMGVTMSHRFDRDKTTFRRAVAEGSAGPIDYLSGRFIGNIRERGHYADYVHEMQDLLLLDGAVHHLDILAALVDAPCERVSAETWTPAWADYAGDTTGLVTLSFANGVRAQYEGSYTNASERNGWGNEQFRAECRDETVVLDHRQVRRHPYEPHDADADPDDGDGEAAATPTMAMDGQGPDGIPVPLAERPTWRNAWLIEQFCDWVEGGPAMATSVDMVLPSMAIVFAAIESSRTGETVRVQRVLDEARAAA